MKLFGNSRSSKHTSGDRSSGGARSGGSHVEHSSAAPSKRRRKNRILKTILIVLAVILALVIAATAYWFIAVRPPDVEQGKNDITDIGDDEQDETQKDPNNSKDPESTKDDPDGSGDERTGQKYTFLAAGMDDGNGNTDVLMVATFDTADYSLNIVSIPRDTLVNVSWSVKKVNTFYGVGGIDRLMTGLSDIIGYKPDFYGVVDISAFEKLVDAIGGVYFDVPVNMNYKDPAQDLYINISKGPQRLDGEDSVKVLRFRDTYRKGDIQRIEVQHDFLLAAARQLLENVDSVPITTLADIFINDIETDLTYGNIIWFAKELLKIDFENIHFHTIPANYGDEIYHGGRYVSYVTIYVDEWLELINKEFNPFDEPVTVDNLNILTRNSSGNLYATSGVRAGNASWGSGKPASTPTSSPTTEPDTPSDPTNPTDTPDTPSEPTEPSESVTPDTSDTPDMPDIPGTPVTEPETPPESGEGSSEPAA